MKHQRTATPLSRRSNDVAPFGRQHASGGGVDVGEEDSLHAAEQEPDSSSRLTDCRHPRR